MTNTYILFVVFHDRDSKGNLRYRSIEQPEYMQGLNESYKEFLFLNGFNSKVEIERLYGEWKRKQESTEPVADSGD